MDNSDNNSFTNFSYINVTSTPETLPNAAVYTPADNAQDHNVYDGNHMVAGFDHAFRWDFTGASAHGVRLVNWRTEQFNATGIIRSVRLESIYIGGEDTHGFRLGANMRDVVFDGVDFQTAGSTKTFLYCNGLEPYNTTRISLSRVRASNSSTAVLASVPTTAHYDQRYSKEWLLTWPADNSDNPYKLLNDFHLYRTNNSAARNVYLQTTGMDPGHRISVELDENSTLKNGTNQKLAGAADYTPAAGNTGIVQLQFDGTDWREVSRAEST